MLSPAQDTANQNVAPDHVSGFNVNAIAIEVPIALLTQDGQIHAADDPLATIGAWGTTSRPRTKVLPAPARRPADPLAERRRRSSGWATPW